MYYYYYMEKNQFYHRLQDSSGPWIQRTLFRKKLQSVNIIHNQGSQSHKIAMTTSLITNWIRHYQHSSEDQPDIGSLWTRLVCILHHRHRPRQPSVLKDAIFVCNMIYKKKKKKEERWCARHYTNLFSYSNMCHLELIACINNDLLCLSLGPVPYPKPVYLVAMLSFCIAGSLLSQT